MIVPLVTRNDIKTSDPVAVDFAGGPASSPSSERQTLIIVSTVLGSAVVIVAAVVIYFAVIRRKRRLARQKYHAACLRDPNLTWEEYARRMKLSQSRIILEDELQRLNMIRKSLQSRTSVNNLSLSPVSPPARTRSRTWHGRSSSQSTSGGGGDDDAEEGERLLMSVQGDWTEHEARVERTWQLLHKKYPARRVTLPVEEDPAALVRPPTIRLKTPPLLSHPMFRGWNGESQSVPVKHSSLPTELNKIKPAQI